MAACSIALWPLDAGGDLFVAPVTGFRDAPAGDDVVRSASEHPVADGRTERNGTRSAPYRIHRPEAYLTVCQSVAH